MSCHPKLMLWCFCCLSTRVNVNETRLTCDKSVHLSVRSFVEKYVTVNCLSKPIQAHQSSLISSSLTFSQSKLQDYKHWTSALCAVSVYLPAFAQCQIILLDDTDSGVQESVQREHKSNTHSLHHVTSLVHHKTL